jgi:hypothetical protein
LSQKQGSSKKARAHKVSHGEHGGGGKVRLNAVQKVLLGGGAFRTWKPSPETGSDKTKRWDGSVNTREPFDPEQARLNEKLYPHLFSGRI